jgi:glyoxylase-like metal-dependent hydrolase (beta-lactamase superfamily II)
MSGSSNKSSAPAAARRDEASRRQLLKGTAATVAAMSIGASRAVPATSWVKTISHGEFSITVLSDGHLTIPTRFLALNKSEADIKTAIGLTGDLVTPPCNITLVRTPGETILIDVGAGPHYMPGAGKFADNLDTAGIDRKSVTRVVLTHAHPDHLWGLLDDFDGTPMFPNASYVMSTAEFEFWMAEDVAARLPEDRRNFAPAAQRNLTSIKDRLQLIAPGADIASGIRTIDTAGHTAGHIAIEIVSGNNIALVLADALMHPIISFAHPEWSPAADHHDPDRAIETRKRLLDRLASDKSLAIGFHLPFPGLGRVEVDGSAYRFVPTT